MRLSYLGSCYFEHEVPSAGSVGVRHKHCYTIEKKLERTKRIRKEGEAVAGGERERDKEASMRDTVSYVFFVIVYQTLHFYHPCVDSSTSVG